jgi:hypothetical protein
LIILKQLNLNLIELITYNVEFSLSISLENLRHLVFKSKSLSLSDLGERGGWVVSASAVVVVVSDLDDCFLVMEEAPEVAAAALSLDLVDVVAMLDEGLSSLELNDSGVEVISFSAAS